MNELAKTDDLSNYIEIAKRIENLFLRHDRKINEKQIKLYVQDLVATGYGINNIMQGIKRLEKENLDRIPVDLLIESAKKYYDEERRAELATQEMSKVIINDKDEMIVRLMFRNNNELKRIYGDKWLLHKDEVVIGGELEKYVESGKAST